MKNTGFGKTQRLVIVSLLFPLGFIGFSCTTSTTGSFSYGTSHEFLSRETEIDWSQIHRIHPSESVRSVFQSIEEIVYHYSDIDGYVALYGSYDQGLSVTLIGRDLNPVVWGRTGALQKTIHVSSESGDYSYSPTITDIPYSLAQEQEIGFVIIGELQDYEVIPLWPWTFNRSAVHNAVQSLVHDEPWSLYVVDNCDNPDGYRFFDGSIEGVLVDFACTSTHSESLLRCYVVVVGTSAFIVYVETGPQPILIRANGDLYLLATLVGDRSGNYAKYIARIEEYGALHYNNTGI